MLAQKYLGARQAAAEAAIPLALAAAAWLLYGPVLRLWWTDDDFVHLRLLLTQRPFWYFFDAAGYRAFRGNFTPLLFFSLDVDRRLFGLSPQVFYLHQLAALSLGTAALYGALRLWLSRLWAAVGAWIFLIGPVPASLASLVAARHYVEVILLASLAVMAWAGALRRSPGPRAWRWAWLSAALYFAACLAKEVAVPLCVLLPLLPAPGFRGCLGSLWRGKKPASPGPSPPPPLPHALPPPGRGAPPPEGSQRRASWEVPPLPGGCECVWERRLGGEGPGEAGLSRHALRERLRLALPHAAALVLYLALRFAMLGTLLGGYGFVVRPSDLPGLSLALPGKIAAELLAGRPSPAAAVFALALAAGVVALLLPPHARRAAALVCLALLLALLPVLPVSLRMQPRLAVPAWLVLAAAFAAGCATLAAAESRTRRRMAAAAAVLACASGLWLNRQDWRLRFATAERKSAENRFILVMIEGDVLRQPLTLAASLQELEWMKRVVFRRFHGGRWFQDDLYLCLHRGGLGRVWGFDPDARRVVEVTARIPALRARHCSSIRSEAPLRASFRVTGRNLFWDLGPYRDGTYRFVLEDGGQAFEMPRSAGFGVPGRLALPPLRIAYESPAGWITYSPELRPRLTDGWSLRWARP